MVWRYLVDQMESIEPGKPVIVWRVDVVYLKKEDWKYEESAAGEAGGGRTHTFGVRHPGKKLQSCAIYGRRDIVAKDRKPIPRNGDGEDELEDRIDLAFADTVPCTHCPFHSPTYDDEAMGFEPATSLVCQKRLFRRNALLRCAKICASISASRVRLISTSGAGSKNWSVMDACCRTIGSGSLSKGNKCGERCGPLCGSTRNAAVAAARMSAFA